MHKITVFLVLLTMGFILKKVDAMVQSQAGVAQAPASGTPVVVEAKSQEATSSKGRKKRQLTPEQFKKHVETKVNELKVSKDKLITLKDKVEANEKSWFDLHIKCADKWIETLEKYQSPDTNLWRSHRFGNKELKSARALTTLKPTHHQVKAIYPEKDIGKLEERFNEIKLHADKLDGDNHKAFDAMIYCAGEYIEALKATKSQPVIVRRPLAQAMNYVNTAETFLQNRTLDFPVK